MSSAATASATSAVENFAYDWKAVEKGIPLSALEKFSAYSGISMKELLEVVIPLRTLKHRRERKEPLNIDESDRLARVARVYELGIRVFGNPDKARNWLTKPKPRFDDRSPLTLLKSDAGGSRVEEALIQIDEGMFT
jgi:putative toxin-antitoxin system antitoxin component (TIGR02293 family)